MGHVPQATFRAMSRPTIAALALAAALAGCGGSASPTASPPPATAAVPVAPEPAREVLQRPPVPVGAVSRTRSVFYATDRAPTERSDPAGRYGFVPGEVEVGVATVSLPASREFRPVGELPELPAFLGRRRAPNPARDVFIETLDPQHEVWWNQAVRQELSYDSTRSVVIFVHGFGTSFETAVRRAGQVAVDLPLDGAMLVYSWPSRGEVGPVVYFRDGKTIEQSQPVFRAFLERVLTDLDAGRVSIVAHSMGSLLVARTLKEMHDARPERRFDQVVLAAPDIDTTTFRRALAPALTGIAQRVTVYASRADQALEMAHTASSYPRVGQAGPGMQLVPGVDFIDASSAGTADYGHGYYGGSTAVLADLRDVLRGVPATARRLERREREGQVFWEVLAGK